MPKEAYIFLGALVTAFVGFIVARFTSGVQLKIAKDNSAKEGCQDWEFESFSPSALLGYESLGSLP